MLFILHHSAAVAQLVECVLGKDEVMGSSPISSFVEIGGVVHAAEILLFRMLWQIK